MQIKPIAYIRTDFTEKFGIPRQSGRVEALTGKIIFYPEFRNPASLKGLEEFSHIWLLFDFSKAHKEKWSPTVRPPRLGGNKRVGVFASRSPFRPNSIGLSSVRLLGIEKDGENGEVLLVSGVDILDNTPVYDIKPYIPYCDCHPEASGSYAEENKFHKLEVSIPEEELCKIPEKKRTAVIQCLADDPRPSYQEEPERLYSMLFAGMDIDFKVNGNLLTVTGIRKKK